MHRLWPSSKPETSSKTQLSTRPKPISHRSDLWAQAYSDLEKDSNKLIHALEDLLRFQDDDVSPTNLSDREQEVSKLIQTRLTIMDDRKWRLKMGSHSIEVREQVDRIIKIVTVAKDFVSSVASLDPIHAGLPWAGVCMLLPLITNDSKQRSSALDGLEYIVKLVRRCTQIEQLYLGDRVFRLADDLREVMTRLYRLILEFEARAACQFSRNTAHQAFRNIVTADGWDGIISSIKECETNCEILLRIIDVEDRRIRMDTLEDLITKQEQCVAELLRESRKQDDLLQQKILEELQQGRNALSEMHLTEDEARCHECFRTNDYELDKEKNPDRIPGTCEWFLQHAKYQRWLKARDSEWLWVTADPGCGKSVLARCLVDSFQSSQGGLLPQDGFDPTTGGCAAKQGSVCYFFFKDDSEVNRNAVNALTSILHQLFAHDHALIKHALVSYKENGSRLAQLFESLWKVFQRVIADPAAGEVTILLDALDECQEASRTALLRKFAAFFSNKQRKGFLKLLVTSRPSTSIGDQIWRGKVDPTSLRLMGESEAEMQAISVEIELVIREKIKQFAALRLYRGIQDGADETLLKRLLQVENRTYLWVALIFPELERYAGFSERKLLEAIQTIPTTINEAYERILSRSTDLGQARKLLKLVLGAVRPMTLDETNIALSMTDDSLCMDDLDLEPPTTFRTTVRDLCGLFVHVRDSKIYLIHQTAKEFLLKSDEEPEDHFTGASWQHSFDMRSCYNTIVDVCVVYLTFSDIEQNPLLPAGRRWDALMELTLQYLKTKPFLEYAANYWYQHYAFIDVDSDRFEKILRICNPSTRGFQTWFQVTWSFTVSKTCHPKGFNAIIIAAYFGWTGLLDPLVEKGFKIDHTDYHGRNALRWALQRGHETTACHIIALMATLGDGVDVTTALQMASLLGHASVVQFLVQNFEVYGDTTASDGLTAFERAARHGHRAVFQALLIAEPALLPTSTISGVMETALYRAAANGHTDMVRHVLSRELRTEATSVNGDTALYRCVAQGHTAIALLLLQSGADPNILAASQREAEAQLLGEAPLYRAVYDNNKSLVVLLLEYGALVDAKNRNSETALYRATYGNGGDVNIAGEIVKLLVEKGADINFETAMGDTPLQRVMRTNYRPVVDIMQEFAKDSGIENIAPAVPAQSRAVEEETRERYLRLIRESDHVDTDTFFGHLGLDDEDDGPDLEFARSIVLQNFWDIGVKLNHMRDDIIRKDIADTTMQANAIEDLCHMTAFIKAAESCARLQSYRPIDIDDDSRVSEQQWAEIGQEVSVLERCLTDTEEVLGRFFCQVTASTTGFYKSSSTWGSSIQGA